MLLESRMIKEQSPLFNQRLRRIKTLCSIRLSQTVKGTVPEIVDGKSVNLGSTRELYGLFSSAHSANAKLKELAQQHMLYMYILGLEKTSKRGCFGLQIRTCLGACVGNEDRHTHDERLMSALVDTQVEVWPFSGPVNLIEETDGWIQRHSVNNWCYLGTQCSKTGGTSKLSELKKYDFDLDTRLMDTLDGLNKKFGRGTVKVSTQGAHKEWQMKQERKSPSYTTDWDTLPYV